jgi:hypothetical protein
MPKAQVKKKRSKKTAKYRAGLKAKHTKARLRLTGQLRKRKPGGRLQR